MGKIIAFIPVRGGSKSIPLKNIKSFCGKPLVYWNIAALEATTAVDEIIVATDSEEIVAAISQFDFKKVTVYSRAAENATDTASTESVMLEYINNKDLAADDLFMLVQATSPLTASKHFSEAINLYRSANYLSLLTCVRIKRFFWYKDGTPKNYNVFKRPRRQEFEGELMENGAFYISTIDAIRESRNRISGKTGIYEMPEYTAVEIDEEDDWHLAENLMRKYSLKDENAASFSGIKLFLTDVDGVLTDAGMYYSENGDELKKFNTHDGMAFRLLRESGIKTGIITSEDTKMVERRAKKLNTDYLFQGKRNGGKLAAAMEICLKEGISLKEVAYVGDDINCMELLKEVGFPACPANALNKIKNIPGIKLLTKRGGEGAVREFVEDILQYR